MTPGLLASVEAGAFRKHLRRFDPATLPLVVADRDHRLCFADAAACGLLGLEVEPGNQPGTEPGPNCEVDAAAAGGSTGGRLRVDSLRIDGPAPGPWRLALPQEVLPDEGDAPLPAQVRELALLRLTSRAVGHDLNNHLASVLLSCGLLESGGGDPSLTETIEASAKAARRLLSELQLLARRGSWDVDPVPAKHLPWLLIDSLRKLHELGVAGRLPVAVDVDAGRELTLEVQQLGILFTGLWAACLEAPPPGGHLEVTAPDDRGVVLRFSLRGARRQTLPDPAPASWTPGFWDRPRERRLAVCDGLARGAGGHLSISAAGEDRLLDLELPSA